MSAGGVTTSRIRVGDVELAVDRAGTDDAVPLLLVHGFGGCREDFLPVVPALVAAGWQVAAADNRGHGDSDKPPREEDYSLEGFAADALGLADALGWERFALLGHSLGGAVAQHLVTAVPERITALVLMNTTPTRIDIDPDLLATSAAVVRRDGIDRFIELMNEHGDPVGNPAQRRAAAADPEYAARGERNVRRCSPVMYARMVEEIGDPVDRSPGLAGVRCPTLVIVGEEDGLMLGPSHHLARIIPDARLAVVPDAGHNPQYENPDAFRAALLDFLQPNAE